MRVICWTSWRMNRRSAGCLIHTNASLSANPSALSKNSATSFGVGASPFANGRVPLGRAEREQRLEKRTSRKLPGGWSSFGRGKIATLCVFNALFRSKQCNGRIDPIHHNRVADFTCRRPAIVRGRFRHLIDCPAMCAGEILSPTMPNLHHAISPS